MSLWLPLAFVALSVAQTETSTTAEEELPFSDAQLDYWETLRDQIREELSGGDPADSTGQAPVSAPSLIELKAETIPAPVTMVKTVTFSRAFQNEAPWVTP